ncbi:Iron(3)-hydroxamate import system permease protein fhuG [Propionibacterium freudenreichii]|nr:Iron(3)-hydroxamate import system permease protein fhuG [Propionibacterium freudenreichii]SCQ83328.1 Iron(3)-hydroxamate import system permease protein fhuG [Propionibacterium freudenreichii]
MGNPVRIRSRRATVKSSGTIADGSSPTTSTLPGHNEPRERAPSESTPLSNIQRRHPSRDARTHPAGPHTHHHAAVHRHAGTARRLPFPLLTGVLLAVLAISMVLALGFGAEMISVHRVLDALHQVVAGQTADHAAYTIVWQLRVPRTLLAAFVGAGLAVAGATIQTLAQNPLADPYLLGVSSGASVGATAVIAGGLSAIGGTFALTGGALAGALIASALVFGVAQLQGGLTPLRLVLTGTVLSSAFSSLASFLIFASGNPSAAQAVLFWLLGTLGGAQWSNLALPIVVTLVLGLALFALSGWMDALANGPDVAAGLGVPVRGLRITLFILQALMVGVLVAAVGGIGFVGLIMPHLARLLVGGRHRLLLPTSALIGAIFMVWVDVVTRVLIAPVEIPVSVVTGIIGAPIFLVLLGRRTYQFGAGA